MIFHKDENTGEIIATLEKDKNTDTYECSFLSCNNPVCTKILESRQKRSVSMRQWEKI